MTRLRRRVVAALVVAPIVIGAALLGSIAPSGPLSEREAEAKQTYESPYTYEQTWNGALRLVRVDSSFKILEKDEKSGFILFEYDDKGVAVPASLELLSTEKAVHVICKIPKLPSYHEIAMLDRLSRKLKEDYGAPPEKPKPPPDAGPPPDGGDPDAPTP